MAIVLATCLEIAAAIAGATPGSTVALPPAECVVQAPVLVPSGVQIVGQPGTLLVGRFAGPQPAAIFDLGASVDVEIRGFAFRLEDWSQAIVGDGAQRVTIADLRITGTDQTLGTARIPVHLQHALRVLITRLHVSGSYGAVRVTDSKMVTVSNCALIDNGFGNIMVSGNGVWILNNSIERPGAPSPFRPGDGGAGDGITILPSTPPSTKVVIQGNSIRNAFCYGIGAQHPTELVAILDNVVERGKTSGIYLENAVGVVVAGNFVRSNLAYGITLDTPSHATVAGNQLYGNSMWIATSTFGKYAHNVFMLTGPMQYLDGSETDVLVGNVQ